MKNLFFAAIAVLMAGAIASCTKTQTMTAEPGTGMIMLDLEVNNNEANDTIPSTDNDEKVPAGTVITFTMDTEDYQLNPDPGHTYEIKRWTAEVGANGDVSIELPAISKAADVTVKFPDLELTRTWRIGVVGSTSNPRRDTTDTRIYEKADETYTIYDGAVVKVQDVKYSLK